MTTSVVSRSLVVVRIYRSSVTTGDHALASLLSRQRLSLSRSSVKRTRGVESARPQQRRPLYCVCVLFVRVTPSSISLTKQHKPRITTNSKHVGQTATGVLYKSASQRHPTFQSHKRHNHCPQISGNHENLWKNPIFHRYVTTSRHTPKTSQVTPQMESEQLRLRRPRPACYSQISQTEGLRLTLVQVIDSRYERIQYPSVPNTVPTLSNIPDSIQQHLPSIPDATTEHTLATIRREMITRFWGVFNLGRVER